MGDVVNLFKTHSKKGEDAQEDTFQQECGKYDKRVGELLLELANIMSDVSSDHVETHLLTESGEKIRVTFKLEDVDDCTS